MLTDVTQARWNQIPALTWTHASAFGGATIDRLRGCSESPRRDDGSWVVRAARLMSATVVLPVSLLTLLTAQMRGGLYTGSKARFLVVAKRKSIWRDAGALAPVLLVACVAIAATLIVLLEFGRVSNDFRPFFVVAELVSAVSQVLITWMILGVLVLLAGSVSRDVGAGSVGPETPPGERWVVDSFAARTSADGVGAYRLATSLVAACPPGRVLVAVARTESLQEAYVRLGFEKGVRRRVYRIT